MSPPGRFLRYFGIAKPLAGPLEGGGGISELQEIDPTLGFSGEGCRKKEVISEFQDIRIYGLRLSGCPDAATQGNIKIRRPNGRRHTCHQNPITGIGVPVDAPTACLGPYIYIYIHTYSFSGFGRPPLIPMTQDSTSLQGFCDFPAAMHDESAHPTLQESLFVLEGIPPKHPGKPPRYT